MAVDAGLEIIFGKPEVADPFEQRTEELSFGLNGARNDLFWHYRQELTGRADQGFTMGSDTMTKYRHAMADAVYALATDPANLQIAKGYVAEADLVASLFLINTAEESKRLMGLNSIYAGERAGFGRVKRVNGLVVGGPVSRFAQKRGLPQYSDAQQVAAAHYKRVQEVLGFSMARQEVVFAYGNITGERYIPLSMLLNIVPNAVDLLLDGAIPTEIGELRRAVEAAKSSKGWLNRLLQSED